MNPACYIAAEEVTWAYAPMNRNAISGKPFGAEEALWVAPKPHKIGKEFKKALYRAYADATFATRARPRQRR